MGKTKIKEKKRKEKNRGEKQARNFSEQTDGKVQSGAAITAMGLK